MAISLGTAPLEFHPLTYLDEGDEVVIGRRDIDSYGAFPPDGAALVRKLADGASPAAAAGWYRQVYGEAIDIDDFIATLRELELTRDENESIATTVAPRWQRLGRVVFSPAAWISYAGIVTAAVVAVALRPELAPARSHLLFTEYLIVVSLVLLIGQLPLVMLHEFAHLLAGRRLGLRTTMRVDRRFYFVVIETSMDGLVTVPRRSRYLPILAGMLADVLVVAALVLAAAVTWQRAPLAARIALALVVTTLLRLLWQFYFFLRTDLYYLITTVRGCDDLHAAARQLLANRVNTVLGRTDRIMDETGWHPRDRRTAPGYVVLMVAGYLLLAYALVKIVVPVAWTVLSGAIRSLTTAGVTDLRFWDSAAVLTLTVAQLAFAGWIAVRARRNRAAATDSV